MEKAFDWVDRDLISIIYYRMLLYNIGGKIYTSIKSMYTNTLYCVTINSLFSGCFFMNSGVRQGDSLSPTLFALFINGLAEEIKCLNKGVDINGQNISILLCADDIVLIAKNEADLQCKIGHMYIWCFKW